MTAALGTRAAALEHLAATARSPLDLLVVGGGITGAGIALDAASRGARVGLVERFDFASGTSSKSSKLVHGGLRYLEQREFGLMREACSERDLLRRLAPHLVEPFPFVLPVSGRATRAKFGVGLWAYDALSTFRNLKVHRHVDGDEATAMVPLLPQGKIRGGYVFYDCRTDDVRLVMENLVAARRYGAVAVNYAPVRDLSQTGQGVIATIEDLASGEVIEVHAARVVSATGVWADRVEQLADPTAPARLRPSKGIHLVFDRSVLPLTDSAAFIPDAQRRRMLFVIPWIDSVVVGTTDDAYEGPLDAPTVEAADRAYVLDALNAVFGLGLTERDVAGAYAGLRPLIAGKRDATADLSRRHSVYRIAEGIWGITGGKLTTYRRMAADAVDAVARDAGIPGRSRTRWIRLGSSDVGALRAAVTRRVRRLGLEDAVAANLIRTYGDRSLDVLDIAEETGATGPLVPGHRPIQAEAVYCAREEMVRTLNDLLARRTRLALTDPAAGLGEGSRALPVLADELGWDAAEAETNGLAHRAEIERERGMRLIAAPGTVAAPRAAGTG